MMVATTTEEEPNTVDTQPGKWLPARQPGTWVMPTPRATERPTTELFRGVKPPSVIILYNLMDNAIKFSNMNSKIIIKLYNKGDKVYCSVKDFGMGIPSTSLDKIWQRFYKTDLSRGRDKTGSGIGLSIVKEIILAHNETIDVISTEGVGTEFVFSIKKAKS